MEDSETDAELIALTVARGLAGANVRRVQSRSQYEHAVKDGEFDVILADYALVDYDGLAAFEFAQIHWPDRPFLLVTGAIGEERAIEAVRRGVADYLLKDRPARLVPAIQQALALAEEKRRRRATEAELLANVRLSQSLVQIASSLFPAGSEAGSTEAAMSLIATAVQAEKAWYQLHADNASTSSPRTDGSDGAASWTAREADSAAANGSSKIRVPLRAGPRVFGELMLDWTTVHLCSEPEIRFLQTAAELLAAQLDRTRLLGEVRSALEIAEAANRFKDQFLAALSHELRTPLNPVLLLASEGAANLELPEEVRRDFATISAQVNLEARMIDDLLTFTNLTRNEVSLQTESVAIHEILDHAIRGVIEDATQKNVVIERRFAASEGAISGDPARLHQAFWQLLLNVVKLASPGGRITVATGRDSDRVTVTVSEQGTGLDAAELASLFDPFVRSNHGNPALEGPDEFGLGFAMARRIVELHGGRIRANSPGLGRGSAYQVCLPAAPRPSPGLPRNPPKSTNGSAVKVLLVEDHQPTQEAMRRMLDRRGLKVVTAGTVAEASDLAAAEPVDLVLSDIGLPDGNGHDLMANLHRQHGLKGIALSGYELDPDKLNACGFVGFLKKPVSIDRLVEMIGQSRTSQQAPDSGEARSIASAG